MRQIPGALAPDPALPALKFKSRFGGRGTVFREDIAPATPAGERP